MRASRLSVPRAPERDVTVRAGDERVALTIGVTGHRHLADDDLDLYRQRIESVFDDLEHRFAHTPLRVLSSLAEGADRLPVEIALARGYEVVVVLPLPVGDYERDFGDRVDAFRALLARIPSRRVLELPSIPDAPGAPQDRHRDTRYQQAGDFVAAHCHVLLALWDGVANDLAGGTGEVVRSKLTIRRPHEASSHGLLESPDSGTVAWLHVRRSAQPSATDADPDVGTVRWLHPADRDATRFETMCRRIDEFNADAETRLPAG